MKICFLTHNVDIKNGTGRLTFEFIAQLKKALPQAGVLILTTVGSSYEGERVILYPNKIKLLVSLPKLRKIFERYDIIHAFDGWPYGVISALAHLGLKNKLVITAIGSGSLQPLYRWPTGILKWAYRQANALVAISSYTAREIKKKAPIVNIKVIPLGINCEYFFVQGNDEKHLEDIKTFQPYLLSVGRLKPRKGYHVSLRVFAALTAQHPTLRYVIIGSGRGGYYSELQKIIAELGIANKVLFKENVSDEELAFWYRQAELFMLLPQNINYDVEGFGLVFLEAAAFGLPVIGAADSGAEDAVWDGQNGFLVKPTNIAAAAARVQEILNNQELRQKLSVNSMLFAKKMSWGHTIDSYLKLYQSL
ncbi:hypothetical protein COU01_01445 [Candidatus Falkowbacteria bacterium CG10_big_fil_rev_8_21_14_0_10_44_15]|uniref:Glycosyl transferase family 1 domain-containing protein n=1 Tax=Candidatus Falkowbacteria bacterium CG10_big_fil_rev_8_21_14_0_10_44_15 TaxID=1974569 RepID=A0A2H0V079_9BACT|nr:MAG: hypothetical protein COU01_01445 [Candidatus Falkowbacteria bacterium CG10_big_fil_rev_8_21_14_0_10_44_15]